MTPRRSDRNRGPCRPEPAGRAGPGGRRTSAHVRPAHSDGAIWRPC